MKTHTDCLGMFLISTVMALTGCATNPPKDVVGLKKLAISGVRLKSPSSETSLPAAASLLEYHRIPFKIDELKRDLLLDTPSKPRAPLLVGLLAAKGLNPKVETQGLPSLLRHLSHDRPVIVRLRGPGKTGNFVLVTGYDMNTKKLRTLTPRQKEVWLGFSEFEAAWIDKWAVVHKGS